MKWTSKGREYDYLKVFFEKDHKYVIWGAGTFGKAFYDRMSSHLDIIGFIDIRFDEMSDGYNGMNVISPEVFFQRRKDEIVIVSTGRTESVYSCLNKKGYERYSDYFHIDEFESLYMFFANNQICISDTTLVITQLCTLKCKHCSAFVPLIPNPQNIDKNVVFSQLDLLMKWVDEVNVLGICGGDAMVHPEFNDILDYIGTNYYPERIKNIEVYSNAIIIPTDEQLKLMKKYDVYYRFTDYSCNTDRQRIDEVKEALIGIGVKYDHAKFENWCDCGYPQETNGIESEEGLIEFCNACDRKSCHSIYENKFFACGMCINAALIDYCQFDDDDCFDLSDYEDAKRIDFLEYYLGYSKKGYYEYCKKCNGGPNINRKYVPAGQQILK